MNTFQNVMFPFKMLTLCQSMSVIEHTESNLKKQQPKWMSEESYVF